MPLFGGRLAALRREKGLTQAELARSLNMGQSTIAMYEKNQRRPDPETLERLADFFQVSVDYLLGRTDSRARSGQKRTGEEGPPDHDSRELAPELRQVLTDPLFAELLTRLPGLTREEKESLAEHWSWALRVIEKERERRKKALLQSEDFPGKKG